MAYYIYVSLMDDDRIRVYTIDADSGKLDRKHEVPLSGGTAAMATDSGRRFLYVSRRQISELASFAIDHSDGSLQQIGSIKEESDAVYVTVDGTGSFVLTASNGGARASSYRVGEDGAVKGPPVCTVTTLPGAHSIAVHPSNRFVYVPHCIRQNAIFQYDYDGDTGKLTPKDLAILVPLKRTGPRHIRFHPTLDIMYTTDEQGNSISAYRVSEDGRLSTSFQTISTLPDDFDQQANSTAQLRIHPTGKFLYAPNRGHESIACFKIDSKSGVLSLIGRVPTEPHTRGFDIDPQGKFVYAAGVESGEMSGYSINPDTGELRPIGKYDVGNHPMWVLATELG